MPASFLTITACLLEDLPRPEFWGWYTERSEAQADPDRRAPSAELLAVGLIRGDVQRFMDDHSPSPGPARYDNEYTGVPTPLDLLSTGQPLPQDAEILGFDVVGVDHGIALFHSWLCHSYEASVWKDLRIRLDPRGLLDTYENAARVLGWIESRPSEQAPEPVPWTVIAVARCEPDGTGQSCPASVAKTDA